MFFVDIGPDSEWQRENGANQTIRLQSLLSSFSAEVHTAKSSHFHNKINSAPDMRNLFRTFNSLLCHHLPPLLKQLMTLPLFSTDKTRTINSQFSPSHTKDHQPTNLIHCSNSHLLLLSPHWGGSIQTPLQPSYNMSYRSSPLTPSPSYLSFILTSTHTHYQHISPHRHLPHCVQAGSGYPTAQKTYIKHFSYRKLQTYLSPSIHSENTQTSCLQAGLIVSFTEQQTGR